LGVVGLHRLMGFELWMKSWVGSGRCMSWGRKGRGRVILIDPICRGRGLGVRMRELRVVVGIAVRRDR